MNVCLRVYAGICPAMTCKPSRRHWASIKNGKLLRLIADSGKFDVFLTVDKNLPIQQKIEKLPFAVVVLRSKSNRLADVIPFAPELLRRLSEFEPGQIYVLSNPT